MDTIEAARELFRELEAQHQCMSDIAKRNFEIQSRLAQARRS